MATRGKSMRAKNFMVRPAEGWLHDSTALSAGAGIFYSFPVRYIGSLQVLQSMNGLSMEQKTELSQEALARCIDFAGLRKKPVKRKSSKLFKEYLADAPYVKVMDLKLNVSTQGLATSDISTNDVISLDEMCKISYAAGGEGIDYDYVTYVAKDKRENRYCHVFDCGILSDDVLATIGQSFSIMTENPDLANPSRMYQKAPVALPMPKSATLKSTMSATSTMPKGGTIPGVANPMYRMAPDPLYPQVPLQVTEQGMYDNNSGDVEESSQFTQAGQAIYDLGTAGSFKKPQKSKGVYDNAPAPISNFSDYLNSELPSGHIYGGDDPDNGKVYGDGRSQWNQLELKAEGDYATLPALAAQSAMFAAK